MCYSSGYLQEYVSSGAEVDEDLSAASVILGVKQVPIESLLPSKTYVFFSHTIKAQAENMAMLDAILEKVCIDCFLLKSEFIRICEFNAIQESEFKLC